MTREEEVLKICREARKNRERADLIGVNLTGSDLRRADLRLADLTYANLARANLARADLRRADLRLADLTDANLTCADLRRADLRRADLNGANLDGVNFFNANLDGAKNIPSSVAVRLTICPEEGEFIGHKTAGGCYIKLRIPASAKRSNATTRKCRCSKAFVVEIINIETGRKVSEISSNYDENIIYKKGKYVLPDSFDENRWDECSNGIHFFMTREEAEAYT